MAFDFVSILEQYKPITLTESINLMEPKEPYTLTSRLGGKKIMTMDHAVTFFTEEASYNTAPIGFDGDDVVDVNIAHSFTPHTVTPPQIFVKDSVTARAAQDAWMAAQNPINMSFADKSTAFDKLVRDKQEGLRLLIDRTVELLFGQALNGKIDYSDGQRKFKHDYGLPATVTIADADKWTAADSDPRKQLGEMATIFKAQNQQLSPDLIIMGVNAAKAFKYNKTIEKWLMSPWAHPVSDQSELARGNAQPLAVLEGAEIFEYSATYMKNGRVVPYIDPDTVYMTNSTRWRLYYGGMSNFKSGDFPLIQSSVFSFINFSDDGRTMDIYAESHPMPVIVSPYAVVRAKVVA